MSGVTDAGMRRVAEGCGAALVVSEMVASDALASGSPEAELRAAGDGLAIHAVQLAGCETHWMSEGARRAEACGADIIDINMGCPAKRVTNGWSGSALMRDLDHASRLIEATVKATSRPVTLKMRLGWDDANLNAAELARRAETLGIRMLTVHGRTRCQFYKGTAHWELVRPVVGATNLPVVVNGDIMDLATARAALVQSGAHAVMMGRATIGRPWLVGEVSAALRGEVAMPTTPQEMAHAATAHYTYLIESMGISQGVRHARKHVAGYLDEAAKLGSLEAVHMRETLLRSDDPQSVINGMVAAFAAISLQKAA
jgi:tRNA-dihydrouridine synthase B